MTLAGKQIRWRIIKLVSRVLGLWTLGQAPQVPENHEDPAETTFPGIPVFDAFPAKT